MHNIFHSIVESNIICVCSLLLKDQFFRNLFFFALNPLLLMPHSAGSILIQGPAENEPITPGTVVQLHCTLEGADGTDDIEYRWSRDMGNLTTDSQISGG